MRGWLLVFLAACSTAESAAPAPSAIAASASSPSASANPGARDSEDDATITFSIEGSKVREVSRRELLAHIAATEFEQLDPYYNKKKRYRALAIDKVLAYGFADKSMVLEEQHFVLRAKDGYTVPMDGKRLLEPGGHLAIDDLDVRDGWQPIGAQQVNPGPFYLVWSEERQQVIETHPRPWQLAAIEVSRFENTFPAVVPTGADDAAQRGFAIFREQCIRCHAINQQGGRVGPDLNVPQSVVEYRPVALLRAYIRAPRSFRYGNMPDNPHLSDADLDALVAYFRAMSERKQDPQTTPSGH